MICVLRAELELAQLELLGGVEYTNPEGIDCNGLNSICSSLPSLSSDTISSWTDVGSIPFDDVPFDLDSLFVGSSSTDTSLMLNPSLEFLNLDLDKYVVELDNVIEDTCVNPTFLIKDLV